MMMSRISQISYSQAYSLYLQPAVFHSLVLLRAPRSMPRARSLRARSLRLLHAEFTASTPRARSCRFAPRPARAVASSLLAPRAQSPPRSSPRARRRRTSAAVASSLPTPSAQSPPRSPPRTRRRRQAAASLAPRAQSSPRPRAQSLPRSSPRARGGEQLEEDSGRLEEDSPARMHWIPAAAPSRCGPAAASSHCGPVAAPSSRSLAVGQRLPL